jgi:alkylhydroperoxidase family enzyme
MARVGLLDESVGSKMAGRGGPEARRALMHRPELADVIGMFNDVVARSQMNPRLHEFVRYRIAIINGCARCQAYRSPESITAGVTEKMLSEVVQWEYSAEFTKLERSALQFADYFCQRPELVTDELTDYLRNELGDGGLVELTACIAKYLAVGRLITVLDLDQSCAIDVM